MASVQTVEMIFKEKASLGIYSLVLSIYTVCAFHVPFFTYLRQHLEGGFNGVVIFATAALLLLALNFVFYYLLVFCFRKAGKFILAFTLFGDAVMLYFVNTYNVFITDEMMGNAITTQYSEASGFFSWAFILYVLLLGFVPMLYVFGRKVDYGSWKGFAAKVGGALALIALLVFGNMKNWPWIDRHSTELGALVAPWSYIVNTIRYEAGKRQQEVKEIPLPDPVSVSDSRDVCVLIIGESARRDHFSLYGYGKETNPYTSRDSVTAYVADASATYTRAGVKAILEYKDTPDLYEILPNYLERAGVDVSWRTSNWGEPPVHTEKYFRKGNLKERFPEADDRYDGILLEGLREDILASESDKVFVVIHTYTNHGPAYFSNYPPEFEVFTPINPSVEMGKVSRDELFNAYDNSVVYADYLMHSAIEVLRSLPDRRGCVLYVSDHGESLGENNLYMHGVPMAMAPREQIEIPFVVWAPHERLKALPRVGQHHVFHSVLHFFGIESPVFDEEMCIFAN